MSRLREIRRHRRSLQEIREIMNSMKSLAYMENRKLTSRLAAQRRITEQVGIAAADLLSFHPVLPPSDPNAMPVCIVIGTERGFCGDFNQGLVRLLHDAGPLAPRADATLLLIGHKLHAALHGHPSVSQRMILVDGANVAEGATRVIERVVAELENLVESVGAIEVSCLFRGDNGEFTEKRLLPAHFDEYRDAVRTSRHAPVLNLPPARLLVELSDQFLFAALHEVLFHSMKSENQHRVAHLSSAVQHLDTKSELLAGREKALRQEEIIEEIEVILLSVTGA